VHAPQPQHANPNSSTPVFTDIWKEFQASNMGQGPGELSEQQNFEQLMAAAAATAAAGGHGLGLDFGSGGEMPMTAPMTMQVGCGDSVMQNYAAATGLDSLFEPPSFDSGFGYEFNEMIHE
jgi:hypothetical protein